MSVLKKTSNAFPLTHLQCRRINSSSRINNKFKFTSSISDGFVVGVKSLDCSRQCICINPQTISCIQVRKPNGEELVSRNVPVGDGGGRKRLLIHWRVEAGTQQKGSRCDIGRRPSGLTTHVSVPTGALENDGGVAAILENEWV